MTSLFPHRRPSRAVAVVALAATALLAPTSAWAASDDRPAQVLDENQRIATGSVTVSEGHIDLGPRYVDGEWTLMVHDDTTDPSVWRHFDQTAIQVTDAAIQTVPDDEAYTFLGVEPGTDVHVVPQTQNPDVVWTGWNTQDPAVMSTIDRGVTLTLAGVEGPGDLVVYLQSGTFDEPDVLWTSSDTDPQPVWVDVNTHTHANWVFTEPGVYLVEAVVSADLVDGTSVSDTRVMRFAVGDDTPPADALSAQYTSAAPDDSAASPGATAETGGAAASSESTLVTVLIAAIAAVVLLLIAGVVVIVLRGRGAKKRASEARAAR